ncbi:MAG: RecX family transcriptional regulator [Dehalococcoidia bacterium]
MIITGVERSKRRGRVLVYVDGEPALELGRELARERRLTPGRTLELPEIEALTAQDQRRLGLSTAVAMLARRPRSEREVRQRLVRAKLPSDIVAETIAKLRELRLLDDAAFARSYVESRDLCSPRGRRLIANELRGRGVESSVACLAADAVDDDKAAYRVACRRVQAMSSLDYRAFQNRLGGLLHRRGFGWPAVRSTVERCWRERYGTAHDDQGSVIE